MSEPKKVDRRKFIYAGLGAVALIAIGAAAYVAMNPPVVTTTVPTTSVVTTTVSTTATAGKQKLKLTISHPTSEHMSAMVESGVPILQERHPELEIEVEKVEKDWDAYLVYLKTAFASGDPPDLPFIDSMWISYYADLGFMEPLDSRLAAWPDYKNWLPTYKDAVVMPDGHTYGIWFNTDCRPCVYHKKYFPNGFPKTFEELLDDAKRLKDTAPMVNITAELEYPFTTLYMNIAPKDLIGPPGYGILKLEDGKWRSAINNEYAIRAAEMIKEMVDAGVKFFPVAEWTTTTDAFYEGKFSANLDYGMWWTAELVGKGLSYEQIQANFGWAWLPPPKSGGRVHAGVPGGWTVGIPKAAKAPKDLIWELITIMLSKESMTESGKFGVFPTRQDAWEEAIKSSPDPFYSQYLDVFKAGDVYLFPMHPLYGTRIATALYYDFVWSIILGKKTPKQAILDYDAAINLLVSE
jgi:ABC-type glycerol-3-phosphate transport system substrate-binding protein